jgi:hypothetical protein
MANRLSIFLLMLGLAGNAPAWAQLGGSVPPAFSLTAREGQLTADIIRIPLRLVLEELSRQVPLRLFVSDEAGDVRVSAQFRARPLREAVQQLLVGFSYAIFYASESSPVGPAATAQMSELMVFDIAPATTDIRNIAAIDITDKAGPEPRLTGLEQDAAMDDRPATSGTGGSHRSA